MVKVFKRLDLDPICLFQDRHELKQLPILAMNDQSFFRFCRVFVLLSVLILHPASAMSLSLLLATDDTPGNPWIMGGGLYFQKDLPGIEIELYRQIARQLGLELKMVRMPWKRCLFELKAGLLDGVFPASFNPERLKIGVFPFKNGKVDQTRKSRDSTYCLYRLKSSPVTWKDGELVNLEQMPRPTIGAPLGVYPPISEKTYYLMFSHQFTAAYPAIAEKIWDTIAAFKTGDVFNSISKRYTE